MNPAKWIPGGAPSSAARGHQLSAHVTTISPGVITAMFATTKLIVATPTFNTVPEDAPGRSAGAGDKAECLCHWMNFQG